ncbi:TlpA disulfide reductase family protein [Mucilaginibacter sp. dw_454]|uniref:TlpA family protein disulfide reductase n=1 Tax=Mucilaginibacter sp. dw_454 TaxID=2720079 RepID=UPI001BD55A61|nr:TlpA disulfide reductase family protein [Mucilaginibacter sp. dw_454]
MTRHFFKTLALALCLLTAFTAKAQREIVQRAIDKIAAIKNISYNDLENGVDFFGGDIHYKSRLSLYGQKDNTFQAYLVDDQHGNHKFRNIFDGQKRLDLDFKDSTYTISDPQNRSWISPLHVLVSTLKEALAKSSYAVTQMTDSSLNKTRCYHILVASVDPVKNTYFRYHLFIAKNNDLILGYIEDSRAELSKGGLSLGIVSQKISHVFSDIHIFSDNQKSLVTLDVPPGFKPEKKLPLLSKGTIAPQWALTSTEGKKLSLAELKGKVVLMEFTFNGCPACMLALPVLEKMRKKYDGTDVAIVSVNFLDTREAVAKFIKNNKVTSPIYIDGRPLSKIYQVSAGPSFYLINKKGEIDWTSEGFFEDFDSKVTASIEALR